MNPSYISAIFIFIMLMLLFSEQKKRNVLIAHIISKKKRKENGKTMKTVAERLIGERCLFFCVGGSNFVGTINEVTDGAVIIRDTQKDDMEAINLDFVVHIEKYPKKEKKKKSKEA